MQITLLDLLIAWFSKIWERIEALKKENNFALQMYVTGVVSAVLILPSLYLISYVYDVDILDIHNFRLYLAVMITGTLMYLVGGAVGVYAVRHSKQKKDNGGKSES